MNKTIGASLIAALLLAGCASVPSGPSVMVLPGTGRGFDDFRADESTCRRYAFEQIGGNSAQQRAQESAVTSAAIGTVVGAAAGAAIGGHQGAGVGAGTGLIVGSAVGADNANQSVYGSQRQYDHAYIQCMYAKGHRVPVPAGMVMSPAPAASGNVPASVPPPPAGMPPPPPPR
ncbi:MAG: hypothetical protein QG672_5 [Pseudomonadota bacterium]|nr:hypothetical protein [Pseudomonadota bacterium]MDQ5947200.1 hypothetical protein [Pseudomonadota bacterium]